MGKQTIKVKHLGLVSTGKFLGVFYLILSIVMMGISAVLYGIMLLFSMLLGVGIGGSDAILGTLMGAGIGIVGFLVMAVVSVVVFTILGFLLGVIVAFVFNIVVKVSGGLSVDAEIA